MKKSILTAIALLIAASAFAEQPVRRTVVVRDGKVISDGNSVPFEMLLRGPRAYLGVSLSNLTPELREHFGAPKTAGVMVESIQKDSPAEKAGVRVGDIVLSVDGDDVTGASDLRKLLQEKKDGDSVRIEVLRGRARQTLVASVKERESPRVLGFDELGGVLAGPEFRARIERLGGDCGDLQSRIKDLEGRLKDLEKKLQK
jgi:membrane-associated protease RseP (regulator of RpoE activity)